MSGRPKPDEQIMEHRKNSTSGEEPLFTEEREVVGVSGGSQLVHNIPVLARRALDIEKGMTLNIEIYEDHYEVRPASDYGQ